MTDGSLPLWRRVVTHKSALVLVAANLVPVWGVIFAGWQVFPVVFLFWLENVIIGFFNVLKMLTVGAIGGMGDKPVGFGIPGAGRIVKLFGALFTSVFFTVHYGMFCFVHGLFVVGLLGGGFQAGSGPAEMLLECVANVFSSELGIAAAILFLSHAFSFVVNFLVRGEYTKVDVGDLMGSPYGRVVVLHLAVLAGGFAGMALKSNMGILVPLVVMKILIDLKFHLKERESGAVSFLAKKKS